MKAFSAPGKALIAGGYLVLDKQFDSYVVALSSRMHAVVKGEDSDSIESTIRIKSPQFLEGEWCYKYNHDSSNFRIIEISGRKNPFAEATVLTVLSYANPLISSNISITIFSDPGYHSQENVIQKGQFLYHSQKITDVAKTGLGSSAGLVTVLTTSLLSFYWNTLDIKSLEHLEIIHNLAQVAHCQAQGKVGSGFDVAAATFGSIVYKRFDPSFINDLATDLTKEEQHKEISKVVKLDWGIKNDRVALPKGIRLVMGDIKGGSNTPKLVSKVLQWRKDDPESEKIYSALNESNMKLVESLSKINNLVKTSPEQYTDILSTIKELSSSEILSETDLKLIPFQEVIESTSKIRSNFRVITERSGAEIEPQPQTILLDECNKIKGVLSGVVPGAGGYDAISLLVEENSIGNLLKAKETNPIFKNVEWLSLTEQDIGIQEENVASYIDFL
ncbi:hypothetical protein WICMUC_000301 [Wickerhamomyces mucosus]|uniref:Phosphomevalonate kinase n=1 Tax=Wickerhamomyces mucosus TaxID=1378264 RepID=A0A9P8TIW2_9ASCO|nr:hypothetical protein WICMUC_000301 [Wickerhamomyces mucosus]